MRMKVKGKEKEKPTSKITKAKRFCVQFINVGSSSIYLLERIEKMQHNPTDKRQRIFK